MSHPLRVRILAILMERKASPVELAQVLEGTLGTVSYHVRTLHQLGLIELVDETRVRGAVEHHYKAKARPVVSDEAWEQAPPIAKQAAVGSSLQMIDDYARASAAAGGFDHSDAALIRMSMKLDPKGWQQLAEACRRLHEQAQRIEAESRERLDRGAPHEEDGDRRRPRDDDVRGDRARRGDRRRRRTPPPSGARRRDRRTLLGAPGRTTLPRASAGGLRSVARPTGWHPPRRVRSTRRPRSRHRLAAPATPPRQPHRHPLLARAGARAAGSSIIAAQIAWLVLTDGHRGLHALALGATVLVAAAHAIVMPQWRYSGAPLGGRAAGGLHARRLAVPGVAHRADLAHPDRRQRARPARAALRPGRRDGDDRVGRRPAVDRGARPRDGRAAGRRADDARPRPRGATRT